MMLVVLWHTAGLYILQTTIGAESKNPQSTSLISHVILRYWAWTEKVAVPGFSFLSGYFGKGFLISNTETNGNRGDAEQQLPTLRQNQQKSRLRWEKTISTLLVGPLLWQVLSWIIAGVGTGLYYYYYSTADEANKDNQAFTANPKLELWDHLGTWYLVALLLWRTWTTTILSHLRSPSGALPLLLSLGLAILSVHTTRWGPQEMRMRVFFFFPYYVAGLYCHEATFQRLVVGFGRCCGMIPTCNTNKATESQLDKMSRIMGVFGIFGTIVICQVVPNIDDLSWVYSMDTFHWRPHLIFVLHYILAGTATVSTILVLKTIRIPLFPYGHGNSTLAIYEWHWPLATYWGWGNLPYTEINVTNWSSLVHRCFTNLSPLTAALAVHLLCYGICIVLGHRMVWDKALRFACDPDWLCKPLFGVQQPPKHQVKADGQHEQLPLLAMDSASSWKYEDAETSPCRSRLSLGSGHGSPSSSSSTSSSASSLLPI